MKEYEGISYDAMNAHVAIVFSRYMILSVAQPEEFTANFIHHLPQYMQEALERKECAT